MASKYTEDELNKCSKKVLISLFLAMQEQMEQLNRNMELLTEQVAIANQKRFGRSSEKLEIDGQLSMNLVNKDGRGAGSKSYMWVYRTGKMYGAPPIVLYEYQKTRNTSHPREFLKKYKGTCVTDGYQVYQTLEKESIRPRIPLPIRR